MLYDGAVRFLEGAARAINDGNVAKQCSNLDRAESILLGLISSLNLAQGGDLAYCLLRIYEYCYNRLCDAASTDDVAAINEVSGLLSKLRGAWAEVSSVHYEEQGEPQTAQMALMA